MRKKSFKLASQSFVGNANQIVLFLERADQKLGEQDTSWCFDLAIIRLYREFEDLILSCLVALINSDSTTFSNHKGRNFPQHLNAEVCEYLICGDGYFDFSGRSGLIRTIKRIVPANHWLPTIVKKEKYKSALNQLSSLRNFTAHDSSVSKKNALEAINQQRMASSGAWLKKQNRFIKITDNLKTLAREIESASPY